MLAGARPAAAQYRGEIEVLPVRLVQAGETLHVELNVVTRDLKVSPAVGVDLIPRLVAPADTLALPKVSLMGRTEYKNYERLLTLMNDRELAAYEQPYAVERSYRKGSDTIAYRYTLPFRAWMKDARLEVQRDECGCGEVAWMNTEIVNDSVTLEKIPVPYRVVPYLAFVQPVPEPVKKRQKQVETFLDFEVNKTYIKPEYMNNPRELAKIHKMIDELRVDTDLTINRLDIIGFASPEGSYAGNQRLSEGRAKALKNYLAGQYDFPPSLYHTVFGGENWEGLRRVLAEQEIEYSSEIERIVNYYDGQDRKNRLQRLRGGAPYRYLLREIYPSLRVAICKVEYHIKNFNVDEAREVIKVRPQNLSLNEMYHVANTYPAGSQEFIDVFETAVRMYPEDDVARLNAAAAALSRSDAELGGRYLAQVTDRESAEYLNAAGVLALLRDDYAAAEDYLTKARDKGLVTAGDNLIELEKKKVNVLEIEEKTKFLH